MENANQYNEEIKVIFKSTYKSALFIESLKYKKELTFAEAIHVIASTDEQVLTEAIFGKMGGLLDKAIETVTNKLVSAKDSIVGWVSKQFAGQAQPKETPSPFEGAKTIIPVAQMAKKDPEGFFQKVASLTGNTASGIKDLYMKLEGVYEKIPLVGSLISKIPKGWRTVVIALIVIIVAGVVIWKEKTGQTQGTQGTQANQGTPKAPTEAPKAPSATDAPKAPSATPTEAPKAAGAATDVAQGVTSTKLEALANKVGAAMQKDPEKGKLLMKKLADVFGAAIEEGKVSEDDAYKIASKMFPSDPEKAKTWVDMAVQAVQMNNKIAG